MTLMSLAESHVGMIAEQACTIVGAPLSQHDLHRGTFEQRRKQLKKRAGFTRPDAKSWKSLYEIRAIRNCIVHANSRIYDDHNPKRLRSLIPTLPGISAPYEVIELSPEFPMHGLKTVEGFLTELYEEASALCQRIGN